MNQKISTLDKIFYLDHSRRMGNSTRLTDAAIQILFDGNTCLVMDHCDFGKNKTANEFLLRKIITRINSEHRGVKYDILEGAVPEITLTNKI